MKIIAIHPGHNATIAYFDNGKCINIFHEEKFSNIKNHAGFPHKSLDYLNNLYNFSEVDFIIFSITDLLWMNSPFEGEKKNGEFTYYEGNIFENLSRGSILRKIWDFFEYYIPFKKIFFHIRNIIIKLFITPKVKGKIIKYLRKKYKFNKDQIMFLDHHYSHAVSVSYFYNLMNYNKKVLIFSMDGAGDKKFAKVYILNPEEKNLKLISESDFTASIGLLYSGVTDFLGMKPNEHEYKVMGLAAYVNEEKYYKKVYDEFKKIIWLDNKTLKFHSKFNMNLTGTSNMFLKHKMLRVRFDNLSAGLQRFTEDMVIDWILAAIKNTGIKTIACTGGVFMNVKMNQKIQELEQVEKVFFMPSCGDESTVLNAADIYYKNNISTLSDELMYKGHKYTNEEVEKFLTEKGYFKKYKIKEYNDIEKQIVLLLKDFNIVARFKGAGEWGARSLCNRAILGNASDLRTFYEVNDMIKMRDFWMPFAPTILDTWADKYIKNWNKLKDKIIESTRYMITAFDATELATKHLRAAIHQKDKTLRPQIAFEKDNPELYKLLKYYEEIIGMGGLLNTSLNIHGYPLVGTLEQAFFTFDNSGLIYMAVENYLVEK